MQVPVSIAPARDPDVRGTGICGMLEYQDPNRGAVVAWLKADFGLGFGHAMAIVALLKGKKGERTPKSVTRQSRRA